MLVTVTNLDNTTTHYGYEPHPGRAWALENYYRYLSDNNVIKGFTIEDKSGIVVSHKSI